MTSPRPFTEEEDDLIRKHVGVETYTVIACMMENRTRNMVIGRARRLGVAGSNFAPVLSKGRPGVPRKEKSGRVPPGFKYVAPGVAVSSKVVHKGLGQFQTEPTVEPVLDLPNLWCASVDLLDLKPHQCRWPMDGGKFCGLDKTTPEYGKTEYCAAHYRLSVAPRGVYRKPLVHRRA